ncbi:hypothetical protein F2Q69_00005209 [Brassica cretica]|uniref:Uncharacterized protein n=1 Tax=Brassica cretica TaxID=69181 RepID=A0A8S9PL32_BRACR|nr:hypothetical protein F2Q69_00005209 [Brassica cretica]
MESLFVESEQIVYIEVHSDPVYDLYGDEVEKDLNEIYGSPIFDLYDGVDPIFDDPIIFIFDELLSGFGYTPLHDQEYFQISTTFGRICWIFPGTEKIPTRFFPRPGSEGPPAPAYATSLAVSNSSDESRSGFTSALASLE